MKRHWFEIVMFAIGMAVSATFAIWLLVQGVDWLTEPPATLSTPVPRRVSNAPAPDSIVTTFFDNNVMWTAEIKCRMRHVEGDETAPPQDFNDMFEPYIQNMERVQ
jgi:hypothetical protein